MSLSSNDNATLSRMGISFRFNLATICPLLILFGVFTIVYPYSLYVMWRRPLKSVASRWLLVFTTILFLCDTFYVATFIALQTLQYQQYLIAPKDPLGTRRAIFTEQTVTLNQAQNAFGNIIFIIADAIVLWRAWVLYSNSKRILAMIAIVGSINSMLLILDAVLDCLNIVNITLGVSVSGTIDFTTYIFSFIANLCATLLIAYRLWRHRSGMKAFRSDKKRRNKMENVLILMVETGLGFCLIQMINAIFAISNQEAVSGTTALLNDIWLPITFSIAAMYPALIIIVISQESGSVVESTIERGRNSQRGNMNARDIQGYDKPTSTLRFATINSTQPASSGEIEQGTSVSDGPGELTERSGETKSMA